MSSEPTPPQEFSLNPLCPGCESPAMTRRGFLKRSSMGFGMLAFAGLANQWAAAETRRPLPHFAPRAKHVIFLFMDGGVSHVDTFDPKPELTKRNGEKAEWRADERSQALTPNRKWLKHLWEFKQRGQSGLWVSDLLPHIASVADELCVIRSVVGETPLHGAQNLLLHTGRSIGAAPSLGAWISYGLGTENEELPGYVLLNNDWVPNGGSQNFASSFLPANHQATMVRAKGTPVDNIIAADPVELQRAKLDFLRAQDSAVAAARGGSDAIESAIRNYETAAHMQSLVPKLCDVSGETPATLKLYGVDRANDYDRFYALQCLRARRLVEAGVRYVAVHSTGWDHHQRIVDSLRRQLPDVDRGFAALIGDLDERGLLDRTLVLLTTEFGRTPRTNADAGRDHWPRVFSVLAAGGGLVRGAVLGASDAAGAEPEERPVRPADLAATLFTLCGIDPAKRLMSPGDRPIDIVRDGATIAEIVA